MNNLSRWIISAAVLLIIAWLVWYFSNLVIYIIISAVLSIMGHPLVRYLDRIKVGRVHIPHLVNTIITMMTMIFIIGLIFFTVLPMLAHQADIISSIDIDTISSGFEEPVNRIEKLLVNLRLLPADQSLNAMIVQEISSIFSAINYSGLINSIFSFTGSLFIGVFSVLFITFFLLRDEKMLYNIIFLFTPEKYHQHISNILSSIKWLLSRYLVGVFLEMAIMMTLITIGLTIMGVENAMIIGFFGGLLNVIPYLGPLLGGLLGVAIGLTTQLSTGALNDFVPQSLTIAGVFLVVKFIDDFVLQPLIYSKSVHAHPLEIFMVIMIAGSLAGVIGMILAIPAYTVLRIIAKEFLSQWRLVQKITENI
jgi:predicted PurR-regulated permease PerM